MVHLKIIIGILLGTLIGLYLPQFIPSPQNTGVEITHPATVMIFMLIGFGLGMAAGYATCYINKSNEDLMRFLDKYANLWVLTVVAVITAFIKVNMEYEGFIPVSGPVIQKYQLLLALGAIGLSVIICFIQKRGVSKQ
ncbi:MAG: hypothetical protein KUF72_17265 [Candidatus Thiodiazotropha sp. (ex Ctena orbiculata)]|nr:hypothetical protein [Candidatus Thiodiazotropha taylori]